MANKSNGGPVNQVKYVPLSICTGTPLSPLGHYLAGDGLHCDWYEAVDEAQYAEWSEQVIGKDKPVMHFRKKSMTPLFDTHNRAATAAGPNDEQWNVRYLAALDVAGLQMSATKPNLPSSQFIIAPIPVDGPGRWPMPMYIYQK